MKEKVTLNRLREMKRKGKKIAALTAYDYAFARMVDTAGVDIVLVGDSLGMTFRGEENTLKVTVDDIVYHTKAVRRGVKRALLVADMPFLSYHVSVERTLENAGRMITAGAEAVKLEGARGVLAAAERLVNAGIPVMGHIGLTPQSIHQLGGFRIQGRRDEAAKRLIEDAENLQSAGAFALVLECVPVDLAAAITKKLDIPTIGIGAGPDVDGQILVTSDIMGMTSDFTPRFVKKYADIDQMATKAAEKYIEETKNGAFPDAEHSYPAPPRRLKVI
ncbi:MAG: 3-methyl-2-oxobutanoate hydroxymethyltransferase [Candidatus Nitrospinota bacterium M3_3B_026]